MDISLALLGQKCRHYYYFFYVFERCLICSSSLHLIDQKYRQKLYFEILQFKIMVSYFNPFNPTGHNSDRKKKKKGFHL